MRAGLGWAALLIAACGSDPEPSGPTSTGALGERCLPDGCPALAEQLAASSPLPADCVSGYCTVQCSWAGSEQCSDIGGVCHYMQAAWRCLQPIPDGSADCDGSDEPNAPRDHELSAACEKRGGVCVMDRELSWWCYR